MSVASSKYHQDIKPFYYFLAPKYWPLWFGLFVLRVLSKLPYRWLLKLGSGLGLLLMKLIGKRKVITTKNVQTCFKDKSAAEVDQFVREHFKSIGIGLFEMALAWWGSDHRLKKMIDISGVEHMKKAHAEGKGVFILAVHFTSMELISRLLAFYVPVNCFVRPMKNLLFNNLMNKSRARYVQSILHRQQVRQLYRVIANNGAICFFADQDYGPESSVFAPFFGVKTATVSSLSHYVKRMNSQLVPMHYRRKPEGQGYEIRFESAFEAFPGKSLEEDALRLNQFAESAIGSAPEQYFWMHRRFKTRPIGEQPFY